MIEICSIREFDNSKINIAIVRRMKSMNHVIQESVLSPNNELLNKYLSLRNQNEWSSKTFQSVYVPEFLKQMNTKEARQKLNQLYVWQTKHPNDSLQLACFCKDETICHRSIIAGLLQGAGINVKTATGNDYSKYYHMLQNLK